MILICDDQEKHGARACPAYAADARRGRRYPSDLDDEEWAVLEPLLPGPCRRGRPAVTPGG